MIERRRTSDGWIAQPWDFCPVDGTETVEADGEEHTLLHCSNCNWVIDIQITEEAK